jgi:hypothetical protein
VRDPCPPPELTCAATRACSILGSCRPPPVITLLGAGSQFVTPEGANVLLQTVIVGAVFKDPGAAAVDAVEGDISSRVVATGPVVSTSAPTVDPPYFEIRYSVADWAGNAAQPVYRRVAVVCPPEEVPCSSPDSQQQHFCSTSGVCLPPAEGTPLIALPQHNNVCTTHCTHTMWYRDSASVHWRK